MDLSCWCKIFLLLFSWYLHDCGRLTFAPWMMAYKKPTFFLPKCFQGISWNTLTRNSITCVHNNISLEYKDILLLGIRYLWKCLWILWISSPLPHYYSIYISRTVHEIHTIDQMQKSSMLNLCNPTEVMNHIFDPAGKNIKYWSYILCSFISIYQPRQTVYVFSESWMIAHPPCILMTYSIAI